MTQLEHLKSLVTLAQQELTKAQHTVIAFESLPENNIFDSVTEAESYFENKLRSCANEDCEGSYNCGSDEYSQEFIVGGTHYMAVARVEYNRHDKMYYYIDEFELTIEEITQAK